MVDPQHPRDPESDLPPDHSPLPELDDTGRAAPTAADFERVQASEEFAALRGKFRRFAFPMTAAFLAWYFAYVLLSTYAVSFMSTPVIGNLNIGLLLGLLQFVSTFLITWLYIRHARNEIDPIASSIRADLEGSVR